MTRMYIANVTFTLDRFREAVRLGRELRDEPHASRYDLYGIALLNLIEALLFAGEPDEAERTARQLLAGGRSFLVGLTLCLALLAAERGRFEDAARFSVTAAAFMPTTRCRWNPRNSRSPSVCKHCCATH